MAHSRNIRGKRLNFEETYIAKATWTCGKQ